MRMKDSRSQIIRSTSIIGAASVVNVVLGAVRVKVAALLLGPVGVGLIGLYTSFIAMASTAASWGIGSVGARQVAQAGEDPAAQSAARRALTWAAALLALLGAAAIFALRRPLADRVLATASVETVSWLALGVALTVGINLQNALLTGYRRVGDLARATILSSLLVSAVGIGVILLWGQDAIIVYVVSAPLATLVVGSLFVRRLPRPVSGTSSANLRPHWKALAALGLAITLSGAMLLTGQFIVRLLVERALGAESLGLYQAGFAISSVYIGFIFNALATDYYPRLSSVIRDVPAARQLINEQVEVSTLLAAPFLIALIGFAPLVISILYSSAFRGAAELLIWQTLGDVLRIISWPLAYVLLAEGRGVAYVTTQVCLVAVMLLLTWWLLPIMGLAGAGVAHLAMYFCYAIATWLFVRKSLGVLLGKRSSWQFALLLIAAAATAACALTAPLLGAAVATVAAVAAAFVAATRLGHSFPAPFRRLLSAVLGLRAAAD
jgi:PST family polysaccharide transporter